MSPVKAKYWLAYKAAQRQRHTVLLADLLEALAEVLGRNVEHVANKRELSGSWRQGK